MTESVPGHVHAEYRSFQKGLDDAVLPARQRRLIIFFIGGYGLSHAGTTRPGLDHDREGEGAGLSRHGAFRGDQSADLPRRVKKRGGAGGTASCRDYRGGAPKPCAAAHFPQTSAALFAGANGQLGVFRLAVADLLFRQKTVHLVLAAAQGGDPLLRHADRTAQRPEFGFSRGQRVHLRVGQGDEKVQPVPTDGLPELLHVGLALRCQPGLKEIQLSGQRRPFPGINIAAEHGVPQRLIAPRGGSRGHGTDRRQQNAAHASVPPLDRAALRRRAAAICTRQRKLSGLNSRLMPP